MTKTERILTLWRCIPDSPTKTREIAIKVGCDPAYVRVVARQRGGGTAPAHARYLMRRFGGATLKEARRLESQAKYADPAKYARHLEVCRQSYRRRAATNHVMTA
jgi:hypothetical protein